MQFKDTTSVVGVTSRHEPRANGYLLSIEKKIFHTLRLAAAMCFIGHGIFGIATKPIWCNYFTIFGIDDVIAYQLMPVIGTIDILMGITLLFYPTRAVVLWLLIWAFSQQHFDRCPANRLQNWWREPVISALRLLCCF